MSFARFFLAQVALFALALAGPVQRRASVSTLLPLTSTDGLSYFVNATVGTQQFQLLVDTGSPDSWLSGSPEGNDENVNATIDTFNVTGEVFSSRFVVGSVSVASQFYLQAANATNDTISGVLGLDFSDTSEIAAAIGDASDSDDENTVDTETQSFFENFADQSTTPFFSLLLPRDNTTAGSIGLGTIVSNMTKITSAPKLAVIGDTWLVELTSEAVLVNGRNISLPVPVFEDGENLTALFDSGFANSFVSSEIAEAMYGLLPTAFLDQDTNAWTVPCDSEVNVTIRFLGVDVAIHPLDMVVPSGFDDGSCQGTFQPFAEDQVADADFVLGTSFLHNAYALFSASGLVIDGDAGNAFVQLLPLTDPVQAHREFVAARVPVQSAASGGAASNASTVNFGGLSAGVLGNGAEARAPPLALIASCMSVVLSHFFW